MTSYAIAIWCCAVAANISQSVYASPRRFPQFLMYFPPFPFSRAIYLLCDSCCWEKCYGDYNLAPFEFHEMNLWMLFDSVAYLIVAIYLN
jgi:hypothetical protein